MSSMDEEDDNVTDVINSEDDSGKFNALKILQLVIASMGVITNIIVVIVFLNDRKLRRKIPNICIINQVGVFLFFISLTWKVIQLVTFLNQWSMQISNMMPVGCWGMTSCANHWPIPTCTWVVLRFKGKIHAKMIIRRILYDEILDS